MHFVLSGNFVEKKLRIGFFGFEYGIDEFVEQYGDDTVTGQLDVEDVRCFVYVFISYLGTFSVGIAGNIAYLFDETAFDFSPQQLVVESDELPGAFVDQFADNTRT